MCIKSGPSASQTAQINQQNATQASQFNESQALANEQFAFSQQNAADQLDFQNRSLASSTASANRSHQLQVGEIGRQRAREAERENKIRSAISDIDGAFQGRDEIFDKLHDDTFSLNEEALLKNRDNSNRNLAFALSRAGNRFGSLEKDKSNEIQDRLNNGLLDAELFAKGTADSARGQDQQLRQALLSSAASGAFSGSELLNNARSSFDTIAGSRAGVSAAAGDRNQFADIPNSINQIAGLLAANRGSRGNGFRPGSSSRSNSGRVSNTGV